MSSTLKLYASSKLNPWKLLPGKLFKLDRFDSYLDTFTPLVINKFQYIKHALELEIKVDLSQEKAQPNADTSYKYCSIQNDNENIAYYFIKKAVWRSSNTIRFELVMDVLNTFKEGSDYSFKANTKINREHKDRFIAKAVTFVLEYINEGTNGTIAIGDNVKLRDAYGNIVFRFKITDLVDSGELQSECSVTGSIADYQSLTQIEQAFEDAKQYGLHMQINKNQENFKDIMVGDISFDYEVYRNIDKTPENIAPLLVCDNTIAETAEHQKSILRGDWYLLYRNQDNPSDSLVNPVECYLFAGTDKKVDSGVITSGKLTGSSLIYGKYYYVRIFERTDSDTLISQSLTTDLGTTIDRNYVGGGSVYGIYAVITKNRNNTINIIVFYYMSGDRVYYEDSFFDLDYIQLNNLPFYYALSDTELNYVNLYRNAIFNSESSWTNTSAYNVTNDITWLDRTDAKNIKLIKLPYCPYDFAGTSVLYVANDPNWDYTSFKQANNTYFFALKLHYLDVKLSGSLEFGATHQDYLNPYSSLHIGSKASLDASALEYRRTDDYWESKLYHSEFYQPTFYYDSFAFKVELEKCDLYRYVANYYRNYIKFSVTSTINSKFMFTFDNYEVMYNDQNYSKYLPIARNNEEALYNVPYINYIRTGYQYDVKNKNISNISNAIGVGLSGASIVASLVVPSVPLKVAGVVASVVSMAMSVKNAVSSAVSSDNALKQKMAQYQNQSTSVAGSDDVDLMSIYAENRLKYLEYEPKPEMLNMIKDLFYYAGYRSDRMGIPNHNRRCSFDYLEADASIESIATISEECLNELINCFKAGVTYIHFVDRGQATPNWDIDQEFENWENWIVED